MHIVALGLNHRTAPVVVREKFSLTEEQLPQALKTLKETMSIQECVIINTCNRMEIYAVVDSKVCGRFIYEFVERWFGIKFEQFFKHLYAYEDNEAIRHLFRVTSGLDSMVIGETQILGQVRDAFLFAQKRGVTGSIFNTLFKRAITFAKRAHTETSINDNPVSVSYAAVELGKELFGSYHGKTVMIIGAGKMSELTLKHLCANGADQVMIVNRTLSKAEELADKFSGVACDFSEFAEHIFAADVVISSTGSREMIFTAEEMAQQMSHRLDRPLFIIDIAVPRDFDPAIKDISGVHLYDIDDLNSIVEANFAVRKQEMGKIERWIEREIKQFEQWYKTVEVAPIIQALQQKVNTVHEHTMRDMANKLPDLTQRELKVIQKLSKSIANQMVREPIIRLKELSTGRDRDRAIELFTRLFALEPWLAEGIDEDQAALKEVGEEGAEWQDDILPAMGFGR